MAAESFEVSQATIFRWLNNKAEPEGLHRDKINEVYQEIFGERSVTRPVAALGILVVGSIRAGNWLDATLIDDDHDEPETIPVAPDPRFPRARQYALKVDGDSMNLEYADGSYVICVDFYDSGLEMREDMVVHVERWQHGLREVTLKALKRDGDGWRLEPRSSNPAHKAVVLEDGATEETEIAVKGVVIGDYRRRSL